MSKKIFTYGVWDLLHAGHLEMIQDCLSLGDELIIGIFTDKAATEFKRKPIMNLKERTKMLWMVLVGTKLSRIIELESSDPEKIQRVLWDKSIYPDIVAKGPGAGWSGDNIPTFGSSMSVMLPYHQGISTTEIIKRCKELA
jgi:cytidyltransferase-like protein